MRLSFDVLKNEFRRILLSAGFSEPKAERLADLFAGNSRDGIASHGLNRFPGFIEYVRAGYVRAAAEPFRIASLGSLEQWDGNLGPGMLNASFAMDRAIALARKSGIGCVAMRNTNHWMRGGSYGWQAAESGLIGICFTNTIANMPPWGGIDPTLGNNPLVVAVPRKGGHIVLDMAMSQYAIGKLQIYRSRGEALPLPGGFDPGGQLSTDAAAILETGRVLPAGFWKGSGLSLLLDLLATLLSDGRSTAEITAGGPESGVSQVFIAMKGGVNQESLVEQILSFTKSSRPVQGVRELVYPGEQVLKTRAESLRDGIEADEDIWLAVKSL